MGWFLVVIASFPAYRTSQFCTVRDLSNLSANLIGPKQLKSCLTLTHTTFIFSSPDSNAEILGSDTCQNRNRTQREWRASGFPSKVKTLTHTAKCRPSKFAVPVFQDSASPKAESTFLTRNLSHVRCNLTPHESLTKKSFTSGQVTSKFHVSLLARWLTFQSHFRFSCTSLVSISYNRS